jgi:hypothetical protein
MKMKPPIATEMETYIRKYLASLILYDGLFLSTLINQLRTHRMLISIMMKLTMAIANFGCFLSL